MSDCLVCEMKNNAFTVEASVLVEGKSLTFPIKIDTGCTLSVLPYRTIASVTRKQARRQKTRDIEKRLPYKRSYGVSDSEIKKTIDRFLLELDYPIACKSLKFLHKNMSFKLNSISMREDLYFNYDRTCNPLLGLDILSKFCFMCDTSKVTGKYMFIGCLKDCQDKDQFHYELMRHFGYIPDGF